MKKILNWRIIVIIVLTIILGIMLKIYFTEDSQNTKNNEFPQKLENMEFNANMKENKNIENSNSTQSFSISTSSEVSSGLTENIELHATYYFEECYVETNQEVKQGENILKYTNGTYLTAPYDCIITEINVPNQEEECTNNNYISISSLNNLAVQVSIDESKIDSLEIGDSATITISALDDKEFEGYITKIGSTATSGKFTVIIEFENDGNVKLGMTAKVEISNKK